MTLFIRDKDNNTMSHRFNTESIARLEITESVLTLLPKIEVVVSDGGVLLDRNPIVDKDVIHLRLNTRFGRETNEVVATFVISSFESVSAPENRGNVVVISGYMACNQMFSPYKRVAINGSSSDVVRRIANEVGLQFNSNEEGYEDVFWYQNGNNYSFLNHVMDRAYIPNDGVFVYGDLSGTLNYMSLRGALAQDVSLQARYDAQSMEDDIVVKDDLKQMFYNYYDVLNMTETYNNISNYGGTWSYYDLNEYVGTDIALIEKDTQLRNMKEDYFGIPVFSKGVGMIADKKLRNSVYRGRVQNYFAKYQLFSNSINLNIRDVTQVSLFEKVDLQMKSVGSNTEIVEPYCGEYLVTSISHSIVHDSHPGYAKRVLLSRNGINKSIVRKDYDGIV